MHQPEKSVWNYGLWLIAAIAFLLFLFYLFQPYAGLQALFPGFDAGNIHNPEITSFSVSHLNYTLLGLSCLALLLLCLILIYRRRSQHPDKRTPEINGNFNLFQKWKQTWLRFSWPEKMLVAVTMLALLATRFYFVFNLHKSADEKGTFDQFVQHGLATVLTYYAVPNNHVLFNVLSLPFTWFITDGKYIIRWPSFLISTIGSLVLYPVLRTFFSFRVAFFGFVCFSFSYLSLIYAVSGRGYGLVTFLSIFAAFSLLKALENKNTIYWLLFMICCIAGFFTIPTFLYPFLAILLFGMGKTAFTLKKTGAKELLTALFFIGAGTVLLYTPILLVSGLKSIIHNPYVRSNLSEAYFERFYKYLVHNQGAAFGQETIGFYVWAGSVLVFGVLLLFRKRLPGFSGNAFPDINTAYLLLSCSVFPWALLAIQRVYPFERFWTFKIFFDYMVLAICLNVQAGALLKNREKLKDGLFIMAAILVAVYGVHKLVRGVLYW